MSRAELERLRDASIAIAEQLEAQAKSQWEAARKLEELLEEIDG